MNLDDHVRELVGKHLSEKAAEDETECGECFDGHLFGNPRGQETMKPQMVDYDIPSLCL